MTLDEAIAEAARWDDTEGVIRFPVQVSLWSSNKLFRLLSEEIMRTYGTSGTLHFVGGVFSRHYLVKVSGKGKNIASFLRDFRMIFDPEEDLDDLDT